MRKPLSISFPLISILILFCFSIFIRFPSVLGQEKQGEKKLNQVKNRLQQERNNLKALIFRKESILDLLQDLDQRTFAAVLEDRNLRKEAKSLQARIQDADRNVVESEKKIARSRKLVNQRLIAFYQLGELGTLKIIFSAESFTDLILRSYHLDRIIQRDWNLIEKYNVQLEQLEGLLQGLEQKRQKLDETRKRTRRVRKKLQTEQLLQLDIVFFN